MKALQVAFSWAALLCPILLIFWYMLRTAGSTIFTPDRVQNPKCVAEIWLEWPVCRGSTLYRRGFQSSTVAKYYVKVYAWLLDSILPRYYRDYDWSGNITSYEYEYGIHYGVRLPAPTEMLEVHTIWSPFMPGSKDSSGEHWIAHPHNS